MTQETLRTALAHGDISIIKVEWPDLCYTALFRGKPRSAEWEIWTPEELEATGDAQPVVRGSTKWDGCSDFEVVKGHTCGRGHIRHLSEALARAYDVAREHIAHYDPEIASDDSGYPAQQSEPATPSPAVLAWTQTSPTLPGWYQIDDDTSPRWAPAIRELVQHDGALYVIWNLSHRPPQARDLVTAVAGPHIWWYGPLPNAPHRKP